MIFFVDSTLNSVIIAFSSFDNQFHLWLVSIYGNASIFMRYTS